MVHQFGGWNKVAPNRLYDSNALWSIRIDLACSVLSESIEYLEARGVDVAPVVDDRLVRCACAHDGELADDPHGNPLLVQLTICADREPSDMISIFRGFAFPLTGRTTLSTPVS